MQIRLYLDEDALQANFIQALQNTDLDVITVADANRLGLSDEAQLIWAAQQGRVIYSFNMGDFHQLHSLFLASGKTHCGIILVPQQRYSVKEQLRGLSKLMSEQSAEGVVNQ